MSGRWTENQHVRELLRGYHDPGTGSQAARPPTYPLGTSVLHPSAQRCTFIWERLGRWQPACAKLTAFHCISWHSCGDRKATGAGPEGGWDFTTTRRPRHARQRASKVKDVEKHRHQGASPRCSSFSPRFSWGLSWLPLGQGPGRGTGLARPAATIMGTETTRARLQGPA